MREISRSPCEYYIRFLISQADDFDEAEIMGQLDQLGLDGLNLQYLRVVHSEMGGRPDPFHPEDPTHLPTRGWLKNLKIYDMWAQTPAARQAVAIRQDAYLQEKLRPLLLSTLNPLIICRRLSKYTSVPLTPEGVVAYRHYFWNRNLMTQGQWLEYFGGATGSNVLAQGLLTPADLAPQHLPWVIGIDGPDKNFNTAVAAVRIGQIAVKHAIELEHQRCTVDSSQALKNCMTTLNLANNILRQSDVALQDVLKHFQHFRMRMDKATVVDVQALTQGNYSKSGEGTDVDEEDF